MVKIKVGPLAKNMSTQMILVQQYWIYSSRIHLYQLKINIYFRLQDLVTSQTT